MKIRVLALLILGFLQMVSCGGEKKENPAQQSPLAILLSTEPTNMDPQIPFDDSDYVLGNIYEPLVRFDSAFRLSPGLALRWTNPNDTTWRFYLDDRARFSDGAPLRSSDVKFSIERLQRLSGSDRKAFTDHIVSVQAIDEHTVDIKTDSPLIILNNLLYIPILNEKNVASAKHPPFVGTGPYRIKDWKNGERILLESNPYFQPQPAIQNVNFVLSLASEKILDDVQQLRPDLTITVPFRKIAEFMDRKKANQIQGLDILSAHGISVYFLAFNLKDSIPDFPSGNPLKDIRLRKALARATNREELVQKVLWGFGRPAEQLIAPEVFGFDSSISAPEYNPEEARKMIQQAGYSGLKIPIYSATSASNMVEKTLISQWAKAGIQATLVLLPDQEMTRRLADGNFSVAVAGYVCGSGDASELLAFSLHSRDPEMKFGKGNYASYGNPEVDRISRENLREFDPRRRLQMLQTSMRIVSDELPYLPLLVLNDIYIVSDRLKWQPSVNGDVFCADMSFK